MRIKQTLQNEIHDSKKWLEVEKDESTRKRDLKKRIEITNWVLENMKNPDSRICEIIQSKMNEIIDKINETDSIIEAILYQSE